MSDKAEPMVLGLTGGLCAAIYLLLLGIGSLFIPSWASIVNWIGNMYVGYSPSIMGSIIGAVFGFVDFFIGIYIFVWLYNYFTEKLNQ